MQPTEPAKLPKNQFRCFHCREACASRDGDWVNWDQMQVHLCRKCDRLTVKDPARSHG